MPRDDLCETNCANAGTEATAGKAEGTAGKVRE
jgi:hypothetical protein